MRGDLPRVTPFVFHHTATVPIGHIGWLLERTCAGVEGALIRRVSIVDLYVEKGSHRAPNSGVANHDDRIADPDPGWSSSPIFSCCPEHLLEELYELCCVVNYDSWNNGMPAFRDEMGTVGCLFHRMILWFAKWLLWQLHFLVNRVSCVNTHCQQPVCFTKISVARSQEAKSCPMNFPLVVVSPVTTAVFP